jgi:hypothetical protein
MATRMPRGTEAARKTMRRNAAMGAAEAMDPQFTPSMGPHYSRARRHRQPQTRKRPGVNQLLAVTGNGIDKGQGAKQPER